MRCGLRGGLESLAPSRPFYLAHDKLAAMPGGLSTCAKPLRYNVNNWLLRLVALVTVMSFLAGCTTGRFEAGACPPVPAYSRQFLAQAAAELRQLPPEAAIEQMLADYQVMRDQARACL
jgi:hypothetical protein